MQTGNGTALITGATGGLGREFAMLAAADGCDLVLIARSESALADLGAEIGKKFPVRCYILPCDLSYPGAAQYVFGFVREEGIRVDILINNAGFGDFGPVAESDLARLEQMMQVNMAALVGLTRLLLPSMLAHGYGRILNVASLAAFQPGPLMAVYYASKAFVLSFSEALAFECRGTGVTVTALCPGPTRTGFEKNARAEQSGLFHRLPVQEAGTRWMRTQKKTGWPPSRWRCASQTRRRSGSTAGLTLRRWAGGSTSTRTPPRTP